MDSSIDFPHPCSLVDITHGENEVKDFKLRHGSNSAHNNHGTSDWQQWKCPASYDSSYEFINGEHLLIPVTRVDTNVWPGKVETCQNLQNGGRTTISADTELPSEISQFWASTHNWD
jgi:hypothetical protein